jgi:hypothetical protein
MEVSVNTAMVDFWGAHLFGPDNIPADVRGWLESGGFVAREGCFFLEALYEQRGNAAQAMFQDRTGYECFVNHFHIDGLSKNLCVLSALAAAYAIERKWRASPFSDSSLRHIVSCDDEIASCVYRCHVVRTGEAWLADDLDAYSNLVLTAVSCSKQM